MFKIWQHYSAQLILVINWSNGNGMVTILTFKYKTWYFKVIVFKSLLKRHFFFCFKLEVSYMTYWRRKKKSLERHFSVLSCKISYITSKLGSSLVGPNISVIDTISYSKDGSMSWRKSKTFCFLTSQGWINSHIFLAV